jgi:hypothetical protein
LVNARVVELPIHQNRDVHDTRFSVRAELDQPEGAQLTLRALLSAVLRGGGDHQRAYHAQRDERDSSTV